MMIECTWGKSCVQVEWIYHFRMFCLQVISVIKINYVFFTYTTVMRFTKFALWDCILNITQLTTTASKCLVECCVAWYFDYKLFCCQNHMHMG